MKLNKKISAGTMKKFIIIYVLCMIHQRVYTFPNGWTHNTSQLESKEFQYSQLSHQNLTRNTRSIFAAKVSDSDGKIFFPDDDPKISINPTSMYKPEGPAAACQNLTYCEYAQHYPTDFIKKAIRSRDDLRYLATINETTEIGERFASSTAGMKSPEVNTYDDDPLCLAQEKLVYPRSAENKQKEWVFVVNDDEFPQGVRIETCISENGPCRIIDGFAEGYTTRCRQKYIYRQLAAIAPDGTIAPDLFRFPSSCCCHVKFDGNPLIRMNNGGIKLDNKSTSKNLE